MKLLEVDDLSVSLGGRTLVRNISLQLAAGELLGLIGPNGAGKSTLLKALVQQLAYSGDIRLQGQDPKQLDARERARRLAYLSQEDRVQWPITVEDLVALGRYPYHPSWRGVGHWGHSPLDAQDRFAIDAALRTTDTWHLRTRRATTISGGERARARLARALAVEAPLLLADEPVAALDPLHQLKVMQYLRAYCRPETGQTSQETGNQTDDSQPKPGRAAMVVMHDLTLASRFCDRLLLLHQGEPVACGRPEEVLTPARLHDIYGIRAVTGCIDGQSYVLPWALSAPESAKRDDFPASSPKA